MRCPDNAGVEDGGRSRLVSCHAPGLFIGRALLSPVDTPELAALVPGFMARHPGQEWTLTSGTAAGEDLVVTLSPMTAPERIATVRVLAGAEVFLFDFSGYSSADFAYDDEDRPATLQERIDLAVAATLGPTRVTLDFDRDVIVASTLVIDPDGQGSHEYSPFSWPLRRLKARVRGRRISRQVIDLPATGGI